MVEKENKLQNMEDKKHIEDQVSEYIAESDYQSLTVFMQKLHISEAVDALELLPDIERRLVIEHLDEAFFKEAILWLPNYLVRETVDIKGVNFIVALIQDLKNAEVPYLIIKDLESADQEQILDSLSSYERKVVEKKLNYPKDSAGRLMQGVFVSVLADWTVSQCVNYIKEVKKSNPNSIPETFNDIFLVNDEGIAIGSVAISMLLVTDGKKKMLEIKDNNFKTIHTHLDQEEVALIFRNRDFVSAGVVNNEGVLVGVISIDDVVDVIYQEAGEDFLFLSGVDTKENFGYKKIFFLAQRRFKWLSVNFIEALIIPIIVSFYAETLEKHVIIAALIQFVVALGGNSGLQSLSVTIRGLSLKLITKSNALAQITKELGIASICGFMLGGLGFLWGSFWGDGIIIGIIAFIAVIVNVVLGVFFGTIIPITLKRMGIDPAVASAIFITILNDVLGFFIVLAIASALLK